MKHSSHSYASLKGERNYWLYLASTIFSRLGDSIDALAYSWIAYELTGSAVWLTIIVGVNSLPTIFITPLVAPIVERMNKKCVIVVTGFIRVALVLITGIFMLFGLLTAPMLLAITFVMSVSESFSDPAYMASVPRIIPADKLDAGIALRSTVTQAAQLVGAALGGVCLGAVGGGGALIMDAALFFLATLLLVFLHLVPVRGAEKAHQQAGYWEALKEGFQYFSKRATLVLLVLMSVSINMVLSPLNQLFTAYVVETLRMDAYALSVANVGSMVGMLLGTLVYPFFRKRLTLKRVIRIVGLSVTLQYAVAVLLSLLQGAVPVKYIGLFLLMFGSAVTISFYSIMANVLFFKVIEEQYLSRMASIFNAVGLLAVPLASLLSGSLVSILSVRKVFAVSAIASVIIFCSLMRAKAMGELDQLVAESQREKETANNETAL